MVPACAATTNAATLRGETFFFTVPALIPRAKASARHARQPVLQAYNPAGDASLRKEHRGPRGSEFRPEIETKTQTTKDQYGKQK